MSYIILSVGLAGQCPNWEGLPVGYLKSYNPDAHAGEGFAEFTGRIGDAMKFITVADAWDLIMTVPCDRPYRADSKPNLPLRAFDLQIIEEGCRR
jgi:hypothetical protein